MSGYYAFLFRQAARAGTETRLLLDAHGGANTTAWRVLEAGPARCRLLHCPVGATAHWKMIIADDRLALGSGNLIKRDAPRSVGAARGPASTPGHAVVGHAPELPPDPRAALVGTREWWVFVGAAPAMAARARAAFEAAWGQSLEPPWQLRPKLGAATPAHPRRPVLIGTPPPVGAPRPVVPPLVVMMDARKLHLTTGGAASQGLIGGLLTGARRSVSVTVPYVHARAPAVAELLAAVEACRRRGAHVRLLLGALPVASDVSELVSRHLDIRVMDPLRCTTGHAKGVVADDRVIVGSANWSGAGLGGNREASVLIEHPAAAGFYGAAFDRDWAVSLSLDQAGLAREARGYAGRVPYIRSNFLE